MRALIRSAILGDATLASLGVVSNGVLSGDVDTPTIRPFLNMRWGGVTPGLDVVNRGTLTIWVHDEKGRDYRDRVNPILIRLRQILLGLEGTEHETGWITAIEWNGDSEDLFDDGHGTITRNSSYNLIGSGQ